MPAPFHQRMPQVVHGAAQQHRCAPARHRFGRRLHAPHHRFDGLAVAVEERAPLVGDDVTLAPAGAVVVDARMAHLLEQGQGGIDRTRAGGVGAVEHVLDGADQLVAVARLLLDQGQQHQFEVAVAEHAPGARTAAMAATEAEVVAVEPFAGIAVTAAARQLAQDPGPEAVLAAAMEGMVVVVVHPYLRYVLSNNLKIYLNAWRRKLPRWAP